jgi:arginyl-tRNA synthetase
VVDVAQALHFQQLFATAKKFNWFKESTELVHLKFGRMSFKDAKMSTRKGNIIHLTDLLEEAVARAEVIINEKNPELENIAEVARIIGTGAVKYSILSQSPETNIVFEWDKIISFEGNAAPYLQYSYARANSILRQASALEWSEIKTLSQEELNILKEFTKFAEAIMDSSHKLKPHLLANYLFELCQAFNSFYSKSPVLNCENESVRNFRINIVSKFCQILKTGLEILGGIEVPEKM